VPYFDTDAYVLKVNEDGEPPGSPAVQPASGDYGHPIPGYGWIPSNMKYSRRMNCPSQKNVNGYHFLWNSPYFGAPSYWIYSTFAAMNPNWRHDPFRISDFRASDFCAVIEPGTIVSPGQTYPDSWPLFDPHYLSYPGSTYDPQTMTGMANRAPHVKTLNGLMLDGHVTTYTGAYLIQYYSLPWNSHGYPFNLPGNG
jgi:prepilin-type processing-associated H-X9-DG protein